MSKCKICSKSVYPMDPQINLDGSLFHKPCAKCADCNCQITISNFTKGEEDGQLLLLCKIHYFKRFKEGGSYVGGEKFQVKSTRDVQATTRRASVNDGVPSAATPKIAEEETPTAGSVRERIASMRVTDKPKTETNAAQPSSRKSSFDETKAPTKVSPVPSPEKAAVPVAAPAPAPVAPVAAAVEETVVTAPPAAPVEAPVTTNDTVIDASPENGVSTPYIAPAETEKEPVTEAETVSAAAAETESTTQSEESN